ncbi:MAG: SAM-dependent methyltransferase [Clostridiales bacterium]|nr:SAM-dependent methyltransferase [Clostridiales bacterium]
MRLNEIFVLIHKTKIFADIGCDHGYLCKMVLDANKAERILAVDISQACLNKAKILLEDSAEYYLGDGLNPLGDIVPDITVISGMGGNTILHILEGRLLPEVIISPQNDVYKVRDTLTSSGYKIIEDKVVTENGKFYDIIHLVPGEQCLTELQKTFGVFFDRGDDAFLQRLKRDKNNLLSYKQTAENQKKLHLIEEAERWLK